MNKNLRRNMIIIFASLFFAMTAFSPIAAQEDSPEIIDYLPNNVETELGNKIPFSIIGQNTKILNNAEKTANIGFYLPAHWELVDGAMVTLDIQTTIHDNFIPSESVLKNSDKKYSEMRLSLRSW